MNHFLGEAPSAKFVENSKPFEPNISFEAPVISRESLLDTFDIAFQTFSSQVYVVNNERSKVKGRNKPELLKTVKQDVVRAEVEALIANLNIMAKLQANANYFTAQPEENSPAADFDINIVPEGLTNDDNEIIAAYVQALINNDYYPQIRGRDNGTSDPKITGKGFLVAFAPRHYNVPKNSSFSQTVWMKKVNSETKAIQLVTASDSQALAHLNSLQAIGALDDSNSRYDASLFIRFDQIPTIGAIPSVFVDPNGQLSLDLSDSNTFNYSTRALVVPVD